LSPAVATLRRIPVATQPDFPVQAGDETKTPALPNLNVPNYSTAKTNNYENIKSVHSSLLLFISVSSRHSQDILTGSCF